MALRVLPLRLLGLRRNTMETDQLRSQLKDLHKALKTAADPAGREHDALSHIMTDIVRVASGEELHPEDAETLREQTDVALVTLGLDSLGLAQMKQMLEYQYGCPVPDDWMYFDHDLYICASNKLVGLLYAMPTVWEMYTRRVRTVLDELLQPPGTPYNERHFEARIDAISALIGEIDAAGFR